MLNSFCRRSASRRSSSSCCASNSQSDRRYKAVCEKTFCTFIADAVPGGDHLACALCPKARLIDGIKLCTNRQCKSFFADALFRGRSLPLAAFQFCTLDEEQYFKNVWALTEIRMFSVPAFPSLPKGPRLPDACNTICSAEEP